MIQVRVSESLASLKGADPQTSMYNKTPKLQTSTAGAMYSSPSKISGAEYAKDPQEVAKSWFSGSETSDE